MKDELKSKFLRDLSAIEAFQAQVLLEDEIYNSHINKLLSIDLSKADVQLEYAQLRGFVDAIRLLKAQRNRLVEQARARDLAR